MVLSLGLLAAVVAVVGCTTHGADEGKIAISYTRWGDPAELDSTRELVAEFMEENPDIIVRVDVVSWGQYWQKMATAVVTDTAQDVWLMSSAYTEQYAAAGHLLDIMPYIEADPTFNEDDFFPHAFDPYSYVGAGTDMQNVPFGEGQLYAFTRDYNCSLLYYNMDHFDAAGVAYPTNDWIWQDYAEAARKLTIDFDNDGIIDQWGSGGASWSTLSSAIGGRLVDPVTRTSNFMPRPGKMQLYDAIVFCRDLIHKYKCAPPPEVGMEEYAFVTGKVSMIIEGAWEFRNYNRAKHLWDIAMVPLQHKTSTRTKAGGGVAHVIYSGAKHPDAAWKLVRFLSGERSQRALGRSGTSIPVLKSAAFSEDFMAPFDRPARSSFNVIWDNLGRSEFVPRFSRGYLEYMKLTRQLMQEVWLGSKTPLEACEIVDKEVNEILREQYGDL